MEAAVSARQKAEAAKRKSEEEKNLLLKFRYVLRAQKEALCRFL